MNIGPKIVTQGLALHLDQANPQSYPGEPTTNLFSGVGSFVAADKVVAGNGYRPANMSLFISTDIGGINYCDVISSTKTPHGNDCWWAYWNGTFTDTADSDRYHFYKDISVDASSDYIFSFYYKIQGGSAHTAQARWDSGTGGAGWTPLSATTDTVSVGDGWYRYTLAFTSQGTQTAVRLTITSPSMPAAGTYIDTFIGDLQLEKKSHVTQYVSVSRASTDGWKDRSGSGFHVNLSNNSLYDTDAEIDFGSTGQTTSYLNIPDFVWSSNIWTLEFWLTRNAINSSLDTIWTAGAGNDGLVYFRASDDTLIYENAGATNIASVTETTGAQHIVLSAPSSGQMYVYQNGVQVAGPMTNATTSVTINSDIGIILGQEMDLNTSPYNFDSTQSFLGKYHIIRFYNRGLSADEVSRNFNAHRTRFGL